MKKKCALSNNHELTNRLQREKKINVEKLVQAQMECQAMRKGSGT